MTGGCSETCGDINPQGPLRGRAHRALTRIVAAEFFLAAAVTLWHSDVVTNSAEESLLSHLAAKPTKTTVPITLLTSAELKRWQTHQKKFTKNWVSTVGFSADPGEHCLVPAADGTLASVLVGVAEERDPFGLASLPGRLPAGRYWITNNLGAAESDDAAFGWALGTYKFRRYKSSKKKYASLVWPAGCDRKAVSRLVTGIALTRDLINTPASDMGPDELAVAATELAARHGAVCTVIRGKKLLEKNFPSIYTVGKGSTREPRLVDLTWGDPSAPKLTLVGKGVCFDSGGLDIKPSSGMKLMKKDMGGAATVLGLAHVIMDAALPVRLRVLVPAVENSVSGDAYRPLDVITTRKGITVEVGNTDAEGRIVLCDALAEADSEKPDLVIDVATLTGAARIALGTDMPALFSSDDDAAEALLLAGREAGDPLWRMPLHRAYKKQLDSTVADLSNIGGSYGGAITAALYLAEFVSNDTRWMHIDTMAYNLERRPGRPVGGEAMGLRALALMLERRYRDRA
jgi:leucyl aminopeptidase